MKLFNVINLIALTLVISSCGGGGSSGGGASNPNNCNNGVYANNGVYNNGIPCNGLPLGVGNPGFVQSGVMGAWRSGSEYYVIRGGAQNPTINAFTMGVNGVSQIVTSPIVIGEGSLNIREKHWGHRDDGDGRYGFDQGVLKFRADGNNLTIYDQNGKPRNLDRVDGFGRGFQAGYPNNTQDANGGQGWNGGGFRGASRR